MISLIIGLGIFTFIVIPALLVITACMVGSQVSQREEAFQYMLSISHRDVSFRKY